MKISLSWLQEYIDLSLSSSQIAKILTMAGLEVDGIEEKEGPANKKETIFDLSLTPNLGHCSCLIGVARELSAATEKPVKLPSTELQENQFDGIDKAIQVDIQDPIACPRYACRLIKNVTVKPSPQWLKAKIEACGIRSINNIVDATNFVMMEFGHPLHAFDYDLINGSHLIICSAKEKAPFISLDGQERILEEQDLLICDTQKPIALAGIIGGSNSEVSETTKNVLLEAAYFNPSHIRRTSKRLGLFTEASKRFERGTDPNCLIQVLNRASFLIQQIAGGEICSGYVDVSKKSFTPKKISCRYHRINKILGTQLSISEVENILQRLGFAYKLESNATFYVEVPTYRNDINEEIDLIEEVARIFGFDHISQPSAFYSSSSIPNAPIFDFEREIRARLISSGLQEFLTCDLIGPTLLDIVQEPNLPNRSKIQVLNPTSIEQSILRTSLLPGLLQVAKYNSDHQNHEIAGFEIGRIHFKDKEQYREQSMAALILSGSSFPIHWDLEAKEYDFFDLKGIIENLLNELKIPDTIFKPSQFSILHPGRQASIFAGQMEIGSMGEVHPEILRRLDFSKSILFAEINLHDLFKIRPPQKKLEKIPMYPGSERDWTVSLKEDLPISSILELLQTTHSPILEHAALIDIYRSDKLGKGVKNATFRFVYRDQLKTISQEIVDAEHARITEQIINSIPDHVNTIG